MGDNKKKTNRVKVSKPVTVNPNEESSIEEVKKVVTRPKKTTIGIKNKKEATKALSKPKAATAKSKKTVAKKKDPYKNINIITKNTEPPKEEKKKKVVKKKTTKVKEEKTKLVLPKEWTPVEKKPKKSTHKTKEFTNTNTLTNIFKKSLFEEVDEQEYQKEKQVKKEKRKKELIIFGIIAAVAVIAVLILLKVSSSFKKQLALYDKYQIGEKVTLNDDSIWYVVSDSGANDDKVKLLKETIVDKNTDNKFDDNDKMNYNKDDKAEYDVSLEETGPYYLDHDYKKALEEKIGKIDSIGLLTTKEFIKIRERMGYSDEWSDGNWLANYKLGNWWIESEQNQKVFAVSPNGSFKLFHANTKNYLRPTIVIKKEYIKVEKEEPVENDKLENNEKKD